MKKNKLTKQIMDKVVTFEKRRSRFWIGRAVLIFIVLTALLIGFIKIAARRLMETKTLELLALFKEDREEIGQFWQDTVGTIWEEAPQRAILIILLTLAAIVILAILVRKKLPVIKKRFSDIAKYQKKVNDKKL